MKKTILAALLFSAAFSAAAADNMVKLSIADAMEANGAQDRLGDSVKFYFADQPTPKVLKRISSDKTSVRTNAFNKTAETACNWVFLSAMLNLQKRAIAVGANAVVNIVSNIKNKEMASQTEFECAEGALMANVVLKGDFVTIAD